MSPSLKAHAGWAFGMFWAGLGWYAVSRKWVWKYFLVLVLVRCDSCIFGDSENDIQRRLGWTRTCAQGSMYLVVVVEEFIFCHSGFSP